MNWKIVILCSLCQLGPAAEPDDLSALLAPYLKESGLPSLAVAVVKGEELVGLGALGVRKRGEEAQVTSADKYHLGSCTKPLTATLTAILVEEGKLGWDTTIESVLKRKMKIHKAYRGVTVEQLLAHVGGLPHEAPPRAWKQAWADQGRLRPSAQRLAFVKHLLAEKPDYAPGTKTVYSNQGYAVLGVMLESVTNTPWEILMRDRLFKPLGMHSAGFRAPGKARLLDQPWGHAKGKPVPPEPSGDNPDAIGPAGTVHVSMADWAKFARFHLLRKPDTLLQHASSFDKLHATLENSGRHGVGGWLVQDMKHLGGHCLQMTGSNTMWFALMWIIPDRNLAILVATNEAQDKAFATCDKVVGAMLGKYRK